ncbi:MAG: beta-ketoacyl-ACP synthase II [Solirubrobacterales bacterium]|nr:beta-ketoacyl-ACP synthase II [Solirubrobacterales bacterium]
MNRRVVITGVGAVTPLGVGAEVLHERWAAGESGIEDGAGRCSAYDPEQHLSRKEARRADRFTQLSLVSCAEALEQAGWLERDELPYDPTRIGCVIGTGIGGIETLENAFGVLRDSGPQKVSPLAIPLMMSNAAPAALAMKHGFRGQVFGTVSACAAGAHAIGTAARMINSGDAEAVVCGGSEASLTPLAYAAFGAMDALSNSGISRPFDARRDGFVMAEGAGVLILEDGDRAAERGATILGELLGYGATADAHHLTAPEPRGEGAARAIMLALADAGMDATHVDYVNAHGTSTPLNDRAETEAIKAALGERAADVPISSTKSAIGHTLGAAGAVEAVATLIALRERIAPPTLGYEQPDEGLDLDYVPEGPRPLRGNGTPSVALSNSFGFGGHNVVLCIGGPPS